MIKLRRKWATIVNEGLPRYFYKNGFTASFYYLVFSKSFRREHKAVLAGKVAHLNSSQNYFLLVQNTHRIEKGLLLKPRKKVFALAYIERTVEIFIDIYTEDKGSKQVKWFKDVLTEYFRVIESQDSKIVNLKSKFLNAISNPDPTIDVIPKSIPYKRTNNGQPISYDHFYELTRQRRSVRYFLPKKVPRDIIDKAILAANQSPSACNRQPFHFRILDEPSLVQEGVQLPMGTQGYGSNIPVFIIIVGHLDAYFSERDRHLIYIDASLANMALMLALETLGLSSCPINWPDIEDREVKMAKFLNLKQFERPIMCLGVGYPDKNCEVAFSEKRSIELIRKFN